MIRESDAFAEGLRTASRPCAVCGDDQVVVIAEKDRRGNPLVNVMCSHCGLVWVDPRPADEATERFYSSDYRAQYKGAFQPKPKHCYRETLRAIQRSKRFLTVYEKGMRVLDIGAGAGFFAYALKKKGIAIDGIEPNEGYAEFARSVLLLDTVRTGFLRDVPTLGQYDIVTINHVFEHLPDPRQAMMQMRGLLAHGGRLLVEVPDIEASYHAPNGIFHVGHLYWYNRNTLRALALQCGFVVDELHIVPGTGHIHLLLTKGEESPESTAAAHALLVGNADRVLGARRRHTALKHFLSPTPYVRLVRKLRQYWRERVYTRRIAGGKAICDSVCDRWLAGG